MIKKSLLTTIVFIFVISLNSNAYSYEDLPFAQYFVRIKKEDINVRAKPSTSSEIMDQLKKGSDVLVVGENGSWYQIQPKKNLRFAYIHKKLVQDGLVSKSRVNVRSGPSTSTSILGQMMEGDPILEVSRENEWIKIEMPRHMGFWIARSLAYYLCPRDEYNHFLEQEKKAKVSFRESEAFRRKELTKRYIDVNHDEIINKYNFIIENYPGTTEAKKSMERILDAREKKAMARQRKLTLQDKKVLLKTYDRAEKDFRKIQISEETSEEKFEKVVTDYQFVISNYPGTKEAKDSLERLDALEKMRREKTIIKKEDEVTIRESGKVIRAKTSIYYQATHFLVKGFSKKKVAAIYATNIDLRAFEKRKVIVEGPIKSDRETTQNFYPLIEVNKINLK